MELDELKKYIQDFFQEGTLTIVGSGLSAAEGIPGMSALAKELIEKMPDKLLNDNEIENWDQIKVLIEEANPEKVDLESALLKISPIESVELNIRMITANFIRIAETKVLEGLICNSQPLRFSSYIDRFNLGKTSINVITTNYDRLIEWACEQNDVRIDTLFVGRYFAKFDPEESKNTFCQSTRVKGGRQKLIFAPRVTILKPHGCLSWFSINGKPYSIPSGTSNDCLIITPGANKYFQGYSIPFDKHREKANSVIDNSLRYVIIGYGFADGHLETHLRPQIKSGKPTIIFTHGLSDKAKEIVKENNNVVAVVHTEKNSTEGSLIITKTKEVFFPNINLWDIREMLKEVF